MKLKKYIKVFIISIILFFLLPTDNLHASAEVLAQMNGVLCETTTHNGIPTIGYPYLSAINDPLMNQENKGIYYCIGALNGYDHTNDSYYALTNATWKIYFPVIHWSIKNGIDLGENYTEFYDTTISKDANMKNIKKTLEKANPAYAKAECEKYCNSCHETIDGYAYYCTDYNLKKNYYALSASVFSGVNEQAAGFIGSYWETLKNLVTFQWSKFNDLFSGWRSTLDSCANVNGCLGNIVKFPDSPVVLSSGKKCLNYLSPSSRGYTGLEGKTSLSQVDGWRYWLCEMKGDCEATCIGYCESPKEYYDRTGSNLNSMSKDVEAYYCVGTKVSNSKFKDGSSTEDLKYWTTDIGDISYLQKYDGDGIAAWLNGIYQVGTGKITCEGALGDTVSVLRDIFKYIRIAGGALFIVFTIIDYIKAIGGADESAIKGATKNLTKRFIILIILLILPSIINIILSIIEIQNGLCGI